MLAVTALEAVRKVWYVGLMMPGAAYEPPAHAQPSCPLSSLSQDLRKDKVQTMARSTLTLRCKPHTPSSLNQELRKDNVQTMADSH